MKGKRTPSPWNIFPKDNGECLIGHPPEQVAWIAVKKDYEFEPKAKANARLIAAAPDMINALKELQTQADRMNNRQHAGITVDKGDWARLFRICNIARDVITKAEEGTK